MSKVLNEKGEVSDAIDNLKIALSINPKYEGIDFKDNTAAIICNNSFTIGPNGLSLAFFFKPRNIPNYVDDEDEVIFSCDLFIIKKGNPAYGDSRGFHILIEDTNGNLYHRVSESWQRYNWNAMVINIKEGEMQVYHNSLRNDEPMLKASIGQPNKIAIPNFANQSVNSYTIGEISNGVGVSKFTGHMKFFRIYDTTLTVSEVQTLQNYMWYKSLNHDFTPFDKTTTTYTTTIEPGVHFKHEIIDKIKNDLNEDIIIDDGKIRVKHVSKTINNKPFSSKISFIKYGHVDDYDAKFGANETYSPYPNSMTSAWNKWDWRLHEVQLFADISNNLHPAKNVLTYQTQYGGNSNNRAGITEFGHDGTAGRNAISGSLDSYNSNFVGYARTETEARFIEENKLHIQINEIAKLAKDNDIVIIVISSHGFPGGLSYRVGIQTNKSLLAADLKNLFEPLKNNYTFFVISSCYSGSLIKDLKRENNVIITAAQFDKPSFGCEKDSLNSWFVESLKQSFYSIKINESRF